jgi:polysaccharide deacetylase 2 family uncharacterized protein YibQ
MPKRKKKSGLPSWRFALLLAAGAALLFAAAETWKLARSDSGRVLLGARFGLGDPARVTQIMGREILRGLTAAGVPADSIREKASAGPARVEWRVGLSAQASLLQTNYAITRCVTDAGAEVLSGTERVGPHGEGEVALRIGFPHRPMHDVLLVRARKEAGEAAAEPARVALLLYGFGEDSGLIAGAFALPVPFAVALAPGGPASGKLFRAAHARAREVVLHLPLEPINYPRVSPGPGTVLVTMNEAHIAALMHRHFDQAGPVVAVANDMGSLATQDMSVMTAVYHELARRRLPFLHVDPAPGAVCKALAASLGVIYQEPDAMFDEDVRAAKGHTLDAHWKTLLALARSRGHLVVMMRATPQLLAWLPSAASEKKLEGVHLVPLSALLRHPSTL